MKGDLDIFLQEAGGGNSKSAFFGVLVQPEVGVPVRPEVGAPVRPGVGVPVPSGYQDPNPSQGTGSRYQLLTTH